MARKNSRKQQRIPFEANVQLAWEDSTGGAKYVSGKSIDLSESGLQIEAFEMIPEGTRVILSVPIIQLAGAAVVKDCQRRGAKHKIHLELSHPLKPSMWSALNQAPPTH
jgi:hypothetical protein